MDFNVCIVGCGAMGKRHAQAWAAREDAQVVSVFDPDFERRDQLAESTGAASYSSYQDAILHDSVNVVSVCTPVCFHSEISCFAAENGRHVLCEKPLALTLDQADAMISAAKDSGRLLSTSFQYRAFPRSAAYRKMFQEGAFGGPIFIRFADVREVRPKIAMHRRSMNGGPVIDMAGHYFDLARFITQSEPVSVYARGHVFGQGKKRLAGIDDLAVDAASIEVTMQHGHILSVFVNWGMPEGFAGHGEEMIIGPALSVRPVNGGLEVSDGSRRETIQTSGAALPGPTARINDLADAIRNGGPLEVTGEDGRAALAVSLAALESIGTGEAVRL